MRNGNESEKKMLETTQDARRVSVRDPIIHIENL